MEDIVYVKSMDADANGDLITTDTWADYQNPNVGYSVGSDNKYAGVLGAMVLLRQKYPNMKIGISVGGWTRSGDFPKLASSDKTRKNFANNVAKFVHCYGYDFVDIDWEYPTADRDPDPEGNIPHPLLKFCHLQMFHCVNSNP